MVSQRDKSADLFALTTRFMGCVHHPNALACSPQSLDIQANRLHTGTTARVDRAALRAEARFERSWQGRSGNAQVCAGSADGAGREPCDLRVLNIQFQPNKQLSAEESGAEAA